MGNVYRHDSQLLHELLAKASAANGATLLIPDLQRPFVWSPDKVTLLMDSLIRGWPFGTLLLWKVNDQQLQAIPFRPFWTVVDRTEQANGGTVYQMNPPAQYHMVLDGQQRVQSMLLALGGDDWGFKLDDRTWIEAKGERPRGRKPKNPHWSKASLCFDLHNFRDEYKKEHQRLLAVDFTKVLSWVITDPQDGESSYPKPQNYEYPLPRMSDPANYGRLIRLSRLWDAAVPNAALMEAQFRQKMKPILEQHSVAPEIISELLQPLGELLITFRNVKLAEVSFLELQPFDSNSWEIDTYNDAIVNIFTRLNTAGRALEREEIILAWLKVGWKPEFTNGRTAGDCFLEMQTNLHDQELDLKLDPLVGAVSFLWSVSEREGRILANSDLLKGEVIRPMASTLSQRWKMVDGAVDTGARVLCERGLRFGPGEHFSSVYALAVLWAWLYAAEIWKHNHPLSELQRDDFEKRCRDSLSKYIDRWIMCSQWAGVWSGSSTTQIEAYAKKLADLIKSMETMDALSTAHEAWEECLKSIIETLTGKATDYVANSLTASSRERVGLYRDPLWIWHRLDLDRWETSQIQLRVGKRKSACEVDHVVSFSLWGKHITSGLPSGITDEDEAQAVANKLGNCALLEKNFNISKSSDPLKQFLSRTHEVVKGKMRIDSWCAALGIPKPMLDPDSSSVDEIKQAIDSRDEEIKTELLEFIKGQKARKDVDTPGTELSQSTASTPGVPIEATSHQFSDAHEMESDAGDDSVTSELDEQENEAVSTESEVTPRGDADVVGLRDAYSKDEGIRLVIDHFAARERNQHVTNADTLVSALQRSKTPLSRSLVIKVLRSLDALGLGRFVAGRKGYATRFEWHEQSLSIREMASQEAAKDESESND
jgi:hypothetical protein